MRRKLRTIKVPGLRIELPLEAKKETIEAARKIGLTRLAQAAVLRRKENFRRRKSRARAVEAGKIGARRRIDSAYGLGKPESKIGRLQREITRILAGRPETTINVGKKKFILVVSGRNNLHIYRGAKLMNTLVQDLETMAKVIEETGKQLGIK